MHYLVLHASGYLGDKEDGDLSQGISSMFLWENKY